MKKNIYNKLKELESTASEYWNITSDCGNFLNLLIKSSGCKNILELGTSNGYSGIWLGMAAKETKGSIITVEYHQCRIDSASSNFQYCGLDDVINIKQGKALDIIERLKPSDYNSTEDRFIDFAFVDANKSEYISYYKALDKIIKKGGILAFDNVKSHETKVADFLNDIAENPSYQLSSLDFGGGLLLALKSSNS
ncbi:MAG: class I SAM-dependent methyltransferase [Candidatus Gastranaerophilaceae bacterium]|jgi:predicted O-methyltransferase YrrM